MHHQSRAFVHWTNWTRQCMMMMRWYAYSRDERTCAINILLVLHGARASFLLTACQIEDGEFKELARLRAFCMSLDEGCQLTCKLLTPPSYLEYRALTGRRFACYCLFYRKDRAAFVESLDLESNAGLGTALEYDCGVAALSDTASCSVHIHETTLGVAIAEYACTRAEVSLPALARKCEAKVAAFNRVLHTYGLHAAFTIEQS